MGIRLMDIFIELLQISLGNRQVLSRVPSQQDWEKLYDIAEGQAILGVMLRGLEMLPQEQLPPTWIKLQWIGKVQMIEQRNRELDAAVVSLCKEMASEGIRMLVFKGQTLAVLYPKPSLRQSGDVDYYIWKDDWVKAIERLENRAKEGHIANYDDYTTEKDVQYEYYSIAYEMHKIMVSLAAPRHRKYREQVVMPEILAHPWTVRIDGYDVPTLAPTYNLVYVFAHIYEHLILDGIGLRQVCDLYYLIKSNPLTDIETQRLKTHLEGLGLAKAFSGLCTIMTDYLGMCEALCPLPSTDYDHKDTPALMANIFKMGNFGHNKHYKTNPGFFHGIEHLGRVYSQVRLFGHYAPLEAWWRIPYMIQWRVKRTLKRL